MKHTLPVSLSPAERTWGIRYLLFELIFLGPILLFVLPLLWSGIQNHHINTVYFSINLTVICLIFHRFLQSLGHGISKIWKVLLVAVWGLAVCLAVNAALNQLYDICVPEYTNANDESIRSDSRQSFLLTAIGTVALVPLTEETLYRGLIFTWLHSKSRLLAYLLSTLLFAYIHVSGYLDVYTTPMLILSFLQYLPAGLILAWSYEYSGSILTPVIIHTSINAIAMILLR